MFEKIRTSMPQLSKGSWALLAALSFLLGCCTVFCHSVVKGQGWLDVSLVTLLPYIALWSLVAAIVLVFSVAVYDRFCSQSDSSVVTKRSRKSCPNLLAFNRKSIAICSFVMLLLWMPWLLAFYPASMNWDTYYQIAMWMGETPVWAIPYASTGSIVNHAFSDHHPFFDTVVYGLFGQASDALTGDWNLGIFCFVLLQSAFMAVAFTASLAYLKRKGCGKSAFVMYLLLCFVPFVPIWAATMVKDTFFTMFYIPYFMLLFVIVETKGSCLSRRSVLVSLIALSLLLCLTKKTGPYIVIPTALIFMVLYRKKAPMFGIQAVLCILMMWVVLPKIVFPFFDVIPGGTQETLSMCFQQTARYAIDYPEDVSDQEREAIDAVLGYSDLGDRYVWYETDSVKFGYRYQDATKDDLMSYLSVWAAQGLRHPDSYFMATASVVANYCSNLSTISIIETTGDVDHGGSEKIFRPATVNKIAAVAASSYKWIAGIPILNCLFSAALYCLWIPICMFFVLFSRKRFCIPLLIPVVLSLLSCLLTPIFDARYALPLIFTAPLLLCVTFIAPGCEAGGETKA